MSLLFPLLLAIVPLQGAAPSGGQRSAPLANTAPVLDLVEVELHGPRELARLLALASDVESHQPLRGAARVRILADDAEQERLRSAGFELHVVQQDLTAYYAARAAAELPAGAIGQGAGGSMGGFRTLAEIETKLVQLSVVYSNLISVPFTIGSSHEGRSLRVIRLSTTPGVADPNKPTVWYDGLHHAREPMGGEAVLRFAEYLASEYGSNPEVTRLVDTREFLFLPCVNPDGYEYNRLLAPGGGGSWRKNKSINSDGSWGVDLNRNYDWQWGPGWSGSSSTPGSSTYHGPAAFSEPETQALRDFMAIELPAVAVSAHAYADTWIFPWGYDALYTADDAVFRECAALAAEPAGWGYGTIWEQLNFANGSSLDWMYGQHGILAFAVEIGELSDGYWPSPTRIDELFAEALEGYLVAARVAGGWVELRDLVWAEVSGDGDPYREFGETWELSAVLENIGLAAASGDVALIANGAPFTPLSGAVAFQLAPRATQAVGPLRFDIAANAASGVPYSLDLDLAWDAHTEHLPIKLVLGEPHLLAADDLQGADYGWSVDGPGEGTWERAVPVATSAQPGSDHSGLAAGKCWVTGAKGGGPADAGDVDGVTRLVSPLIRAGHLHHLELEYARWFTGPGGPATLDQWLAEVSNDDGASWVTLERLRESTAWEVPTFDLEDYLTLTSEMRLRITVQDTGGDDTVEGLLDDLVLRSRGTGPTLGLWGDTRLGRPIELFLDDPRTPLGNYRLLWSFTAGPGVPTPGIAGRLFLTGTVRTLLTGTSDAQGAALIPSRIPSLSALKNVTVHMQIVAGQGGAQVAYSNLISFRID